MFQVIFREVPKHVFADMSLSFSVLGDGFKSLVVGQVLRKLKKQII